jgi:uncharacterized protein YndB with AHSA1/START domain
MEEKTIKVVKKINIGVHQVYFALTNATKLRHWLCDFSSISVKIGGRVYLAWESGYFASGKIVELVQDKKVSYEWRGSNDPASSLVTFSLEQLKDGTSLLLEHSRLGNSIEWATTLEEIEKGWSLSLDNLVSMLETGIDLRISQRPFIGIYPEEYYRENQSDPIPVESGIRIIDVISGHNAEKVGLKSGDVIVGLNDIQITTYPTLTKAISQFKAGDTIDLTIYREGSKFIQTMQLSHLNLPKVPESPALLADQLREAQAKILAGLSSILADVTESEADFRPGLEEWSIKEIIAHLIHSERDHQVWIGNLVLSQEPLVDEFAGNLNARVKATASLYPNLSDLLSAYKTSIEETALCVSLLPLSITSDKGVFWRLAFVGLQLPMHSQSHFDQITNNLKLAKNG